MYYNTSTLDVSSLLVTVQSIRHFNISTELTDRWFAAACLPSDETAFIWLMIDNFRKASSRNHKLRKLQGAGIPTVDRNALETDIPRSLLQRLGIRPNIQYLIDVGILRRHARAYRRGQYCYRYIVTCPQLINALQQLSPVTIVKSKSQRQSKVDVAARDRAKQFKKRHGAEYMQSGEFIFGPTVKFVLDRVKADPSASNLQKLETLVRLIASGTYDEETDLLTYQHNHIQHEVGGRIQSSDSTLAADVKRVAYPKSRYKNYDLRACHVRFIHHVFPHPLLAEYLAIDTEGNSKLITRLKGVDSRLTKRVVKPAVLALLNGAAYNRFTFDDAGEISGLGAIYKDICGKNVEVFKSLVTQLKPLRKHMKEVKHTLQHSSSYWCGADYLNAAGVVLPEDKLTSITSHWMLGYETEFIWRLTNLATVQRHKYRVISNQYDGLIVEGKIPRAAIRDAAKGLLPEHCFQLQEKDL